MRLALTGVLSVGCGFGMTVLSSLLYGVTATDPGNICRRITLLLSSSFGLLHPCTESTGWTNVALRYE